MRRIVSEKSSLEVQREAVLPRSDAPQRGREIHCHVAAKVQLIEWGPME
jgi:hypothetical protein